MVAYSIFTSGGDFLIKHASPRSDTQHKKLRVFSIVIIDITAIRMFHFRDNIDARLDRKQVIR